MALIYHLPIGKNAGFTQIATTFSKLALWLIIEFIPKTDPKIALLLQNRADIFETYNELSFTNAFEKLFAIEKRKILTYPDRILFLINRKDAPPENYY